MQREEIVQLPSISQLLNVSGGGEGDKEVKKELLRCIENVENAGDFAAFGGLFDFTNPQLFVPGVGDIFLPLIEEKARDLIQQCHQAPFGKGEQTIVDTSVRKTWELNKDKFEIRNPLWNQHVVVKAMHAALRGMGFDQKKASLVRADLYKMLLYEKGAMFKPHKDTEKAPGMFATLVICLPAGHEGGAVKLNHGKESKEFRTDRQNPSFLCWYSDVVHEITEITAGYRFVLTYNLILTDHIQAPSAAVVSGSVHSVQLALQAWKEELTSSNPRYPYLIHLLDHQYTTSNLSISKLKGRDLTIANAMRRACQNTESICFLASCHREVSGGVDDGSEYADGFYELDPWDDDDEEEDDDDDESDEEEVPEGNQRRRNSNFHTIFEIVDDEIILKEVTDFHGNIVAQDLPVEDNNFLIDDPFSSREPDDEEYTGFTGNEGCNATQWYWNTVLVVVPTSQVASFIVKQFRNRAESWCYTSLKNRPERTVDSTQVFRHFQRLYEAEPSNRESRIILHELAREMVAGKTGAIPTEISAEIAKVAVEFDDPTLLGNAAFSNAGRLSTDGLSELGELLGKQPLEKFKRMLAGYLLCLPTIYEAYSAVQSICRAISSQPYDLEEAKVQKIALLSANMVDLLRIRKPKYPMDGQALVWLMQEGQDIRVEHGLIILAISENTSLAEFSYFSIGFLNEFFHQPLTLPKNAVENTFVSVLDQFLLHFNLRDPELESAEKQAELRRSRYWYGHQQKPEPLKSKILPIIPSYFATLAQQLLQRFPSKAETLLAKIKDSVEQWPSLYFNHLWLPILKTMHTVFGQLGVDHDDTVYTNFLRALFSSILKSYMVRYVGPRPQCPEKDWARLPVHCVCDDCSRLNIFLRNPNEQIGRFPMGKKRRAHLHSKIERAEGSYTHETEHRGNPQTLVITKTRPAWDEKVKDWKKRQAEAIALFKSFDQNLLHGLLADQYAEVVPESVRVSAGTASRRGRTTKKQKTGETSAHPVVPLSMSSGNTDPLLARSNGTARSGMKRKVEESGIIDLTEEND